MGQLLFKVYGNCLYTDTYEILKGKDFALSEDMNPSASREEQVILKRGQRVPALSLSHMLWTPPCSLNVPGKAKYPSA